MIEVRFAEPEDSRTIAQLVCDMDLEREPDARAEGFVDRYAEVWLTDYQDRSTWIAELPGGEVVGLVQTVRIRRMPSLLRGEASWLQVSRVYVRPEHRDGGLGEQMLRVMIAWGDEHGVDRYQLKAVPEARSLYGRVGFGGVDERFMELTR